MSSQYFKRLHLVLKITMKDGAFIVVFVLLGYVQSAPTGSETIWVEDVTTRFQTDKRTPSNHDLPDHLTFHLRRGSHMFNLNLERNLDINPNTDMYFVRKVKNGRLRIIKSRNLKKENVAYYQDRDNGASMTVRCVKRSTESCDRVINGNIRIGDRSYELRPAEGDVTLRNLFVRPGLLDKRYVLQDTATIQSKISVEKKKENVDEKNVQPMWIYRRLHEQRVWLSSRNIAALDNREATSDKNYSDENDGEEKTRWLKKTYYVDIAVMVDSSIWDLYASTVQVTNIEKKRDEVKRKIREAYSHIMNGVNMLYKGIDDTSISIRVILCAFIFVQHAALFPHNSSKVNRINGTTCIGSYPYHNDLSEWDMTYGVNFTPSFDHVMLFTRHDMYKDSIANNDIFGVCWQGGVCKPGKRTSVVQTDDYVRTVRTAAHELGHNLGAYHDGDDEAKDCSARDLFIMAPVDIRNDPSRLYTRNPWDFSTCSVASFKKRLKLKECVRKKGKVYNDTEWKGYVAKQPGEVYNPDEQCHLIIGPKSTYCVADLWTICHTMQCRDPKTKECMNIYFSAAPGTKCGDNRVCFEGRCVPKVSK